MRNHHASRAAVCAVCWNRKGKKVDFVLREGSKLEQAVRDYVDSKYSARSVHTPCGLCTDCRLRLNDHVQGKSHPRPLLIATGFKLGKVEPDGPGCECHICYLASLNGNRVPQLLLRLTTSEWVIYLTFLQQHIWCHFMIFPINLESPRS